MLKLKRGLIVSCQALEEEPLHGDGIMAKMAKAAMIGGAVGIRANGVTDIADIKKACELPVIGIIKRNYQGYDVYITPSMTEVNELLQVKPDVIALDCTMRPRPGFETPEAYIKTIKANYDVCLMADISTYEEGVNAFLAGADIIATTMAGYTDYTSDRKLPDFELIGRLADKISVPVIAEGHIDDPELARKCLEAGAYAVVVGSAITRPQLITKKFVEGIKGAILI